MPWVFTEHGAISQVFGAHFAEEFFVRLAGDTAGLDVFGPTFARRQRQRFFAMLRMTAFGERTAC
jgi:hypothetical protein